MRRRTLSVPDALRHLVGLQAQVPSNPYVALWSRLERFESDDLARLILDRSAVRLALMRSTIHLATAEDCLALRRVMQPALDRALYSGSPYGRRIAGVDVGELVAAGRALLEETPRALADLRKLLHERWPDRDAQSLAYAVHYLLPLVQIPPRGPWGASARPTCTTAKHWLGRPLAPDTSNDAVLLRYLAAFGPATSADAQSWSGVPRLRDVFERLRPRLRTFRDERDRELFDLPDAPLPHPDTPAPPRFLPEYDSIFHSHADRSRIVPQTHREWAAAHLGQGTVLLAGFVHATWKIARDRDVATLGVVIMDRLSQRDSTALGDEGARFLAFVDPKSRSHDVRLTLFED